VWDALDAYDGSVAAVFTRRSSTRASGRPRPALHFLADGGFAGRRRDRAAFDDDRNYSTLEVRIAQTVFEIAAEALHAAFAPVIAATFRLERVETRMDSP